VILLALNGLALAAHDRWDADYGFVAVVLVQGTIWLLAASLAERAPGGAATVSVVLLMAACCASRFCSKRRCIRPTHTATSGTAASRRRGSIPTASFRPIRRWPLCAIGRSIPGSTALIMP
jgi:hypothetical protein